MVQSAGVIAAVDPDAGEATRAGPPTRGPFDRDEQSPPIPTVIVTVTSILTGACMLFAMILCVYVIRGAMRDRPSELTIRLLMSCIACFVGLAFASLGFGLFLLRARGSFRARMDGVGGEPPALIESTAPGLIVIVCATVVMWLALRVHFEQTTTMPAAAHVAAAAAAAVPERAVAKPVLLHIEDGVQTP
jgi:hypothetical protein